MFEPGQRVVVTRPTTRLLDGERGTRLGGHIPHRFTGVVISYANTLGWLEVRIDEEFNPGPVFGKITWYCAPRWVQPMGGPW